MQLCALYEFCRFTLYSHQAFDYFHSSHTTVSQCHSVTVVTVVTLSQKSRVITAAQRGCQWQPRCVTVSHLHDATGRNQDIFIFSNTRFTTEELLSWQYNSMDNLTKTSGGHLGIAQHWFWSDCATTQCGTTSFCPIDPIPPLSSLYLCQIFLVFLSLEYPYIRLICIFVKYFLVFCLSVSRFLSLCFSLTLIIDHTMAGL